MDEQNEQAFDFDGFEEALSGESTEADKPDGELGGNDEVRQETAEAAQAEENGADGNDAKKEEKADSGDSGGPEGNKQETFTLRVNHEDRIVGKDELLALAQKGADYDRVKANAKSASDFQSEFSGTIQTLQEVAGRLKIPVGELIDRFRLNLMTNEGLSEEAARERLAREKAEQELNTLRSAAKEKEAAKNSNAERAKREIAEFQQKFPGVKLDNDALKSMTDDVKNGMTLSEAYQARKMREQEAKIKQLQDELEAAKQNKKNQEQSPGSQTDIGAPNAKTPFDDFMSAFSAE